MSEQFRIVVSISLALLAASCATVPLPPRLDVETCRPFTVKYAPRLLLGNTVAIPKEARVPFAIYMVAIHQRLHPIFEEEVKAERAAHSDLRDAGDLSTRVEMVLAEADGSIARLGVIRSSGSAVFDIVALAALRRAAPFGRPHPSIVSPDGMAYLHWEFHNDPHEGCFTRSVLPFLLARPLP